MSNVERRIAEVQTELCLSLHALAVVAGQQMKGWLALAFAPHLDFAHHHNKYHLNITLRRSQSSEVCGVERQTLKASPYSPHTTTAPQAQSPRRIDKGSMHPRQSFRSTASAKVAKGAKGSSSGLSRRQKRVEELASAAGLRRGAQPRRRYQVKR